MDRSPSLPDPKNSLAESSHSWWRAVVLLWLVIAAGHFNRTSIQVAGTERIIHDGVLTPNQMGWVYTAFLLPYTLAMVPTGWIIDRVGARAGLIALCFGSAFFVAATGLVGSLYKSGTILHTSLAFFVGLLGIRALMGAVNAPLHPGAARLVYSEVPSHAKSFANGFVTSAACVGVAATYYGFGRLIDRFDWPRAMLVTGIITLILAIVWTAGTRGVGKRLEATPSRAREPNQDVWSILRHRGVMLLTMSYASLGYLQYLFFYWIQYYIEEVEGLGKDASRMYSTLIQLSMGVGMVCGGWLADRMSPSELVNSRRGRVPMFGLAGSGVVFVCGLMSSERYILLATFAVTAALIGLCEGAFWTTVVEMGGARGGLAGGVMNMGGNLGGMLSPVATPALGALFVKLSFDQTTAWRMSLAVGGIVAIAGAMMWLGVAQEQKTSNAEPRTIQDSAERSTK